MGNYRFRFSDMIPNAWFYKLKDMSKPRTRKPYISPIKKKPSPTSQKHHINSNYLLTTDSEPWKPAAASLYHLEASVPAPPRKSLKTRNRRRTVYKPSHSPDYSLSPFETDDSLLSDSDVDDDFFAPSTTDIIMDMSHKKEDAFYAISDQLHLPPILTKPPKSNHEFSKCSSKARTSLPVKLVKEEDSIRTTPKDSRIGRKSFGNSPAGIKLRPNSPKIASKKINQAYARKSKSINISLASACRNRRIAESFAVVKSSVDPQRDFRDSMVEMIVENNIRDSKDMEDLLASYLSLNSNQYHPLIIKAFEQIWLDMTNLCL